MKRSLLRKGLPAVGMVAALGLISAVPSNASSHREAPSITEDPVADLTDLYAFVSPDRPDSTTFVINTDPFQNPGGGPNFSKFGDDVLYELNIDNNGDAVADIKYQLRFKTTYGNPNTFLYNTNQVTSVDDPDLNRKQTYTLTEVRGKSSKPIGQNLLTAPAYVGATRSTPNYRATAAGANYQLENGAIKVFAGPRDDPFFADLGAIFDLGGLRPLNQFHIIKQPTAAGIDYLAGQNISSIVLQVPSSRITNAGDPVVGVWATTSRRIGEGNGNDEGNGNWKQVARLGNPLVNEVVIPVGMKDKFNASSPDKDAQFGKYVLDPELGKLIPFLYGPAGIKVPTSVDAGLPAAFAGRQDLAVIFLTGIAGLNKSKTFSAPSEQLRLNTSIAKSSFPNGRNLTDDVVDTALQVVAGANPLVSDKTFTGFPNNALGDGVNANDRELMDVFPYVGLPRDGYGADRGVEPMKP
jgi:Domain of unknown function (DUF4331)